ncbi:MAG TPA: HEXXH motif-containing putative peptide modification protein [Pseudonocardiaceae bacterium]|jgi:hypothetical protein|nr:HEXXH motif-containing putative peptide modification protein [Pseudonocardiaceae bacterium]
MILPPQAEPTRCDIPALHASIAAPSVLQRERQALYQLAAELLEPGNVQALDPDVIDSPMARHHIGEALAGRASFTRSQLVGISAVATDEPSRDEPSGAEGLRVAARPEANTLLAGALDMVAAELDRQRAASGQPELLTEADGARFTFAQRLLHEGLALARSVSPELIEDLLAHVALIGVVDTQRTGRLGSASPRTFPGLILLGSSRSSIEVAEALIHEGAHQKLFDLAITHDLLNDTSDRCAPFHPPWAEKKRRWPLEQTLAACHAYACLAKFAQDISMTLEAVGVDADSLLPVASARSEIIGDWLQDKSDYLGTDAHALLVGLLGRPMRTRCSAQNPANTLATDFIIDPGLQLRRCGSPNRVLVGRPSRPPQLYWVSEDAAALLEFLSHKPLNEIVDTFAQRWRISRLDAADRFNALLGDLCTSGVLTQRGNGGSNK